MRSLFLVLFVTALCTAPALAADAPATYTDTKNGFSMNAPDLGASPAPVMFLGPALHGFSPNVNVSIQMIKSTRKDYLDLSLKQFAQVKATVNSQKEMTVSGHDAVMVDYEMTPATKTTRHLALIVVTDDRVYLVTATALKDDFAASEQAFRKCLESFTVPK